MVPRKLRPVGCRVPLPRKAGTVFPWETRYSCEYTRSGTEALSLAVRLAIAERPDVQSPEVLLPAYGCPDLVAAVVAQGARPVLVDLADDESPLMNAGGVVEAITGDTVAVIAVGFLGIPERLKSLSEVCRANELLLIEDSAQCFPPASVESGVADLVVLSFGRGKPINLMGGGALLIRKDYLDRFMSFISVYPLIRRKISPLWHLKRTLFNLMLSRFSYALMEKMPFLHLGETRLHSLEDVCRIDIPRSLVTAGIQQYEEKPVWQQLYSRKLSFMDRYGWVRLHSLHESGAGVGGKCLRYALLAPNQYERDTMIASLNKAGIAGNSFYGKALSNIEGVGELLGKARTYPAAEAFASRLLTLPCHSGVTEADIEKITSCFSNLAR